MMSGFFLDVIFDCPYEMDELVSSQTISNALKSLNDNQKEVIYFRVIRGFSPQRIAKMRKQTDRNIRQVYDMAIESIRRKLRNGAKK
jgi:DNA-directed RNA polymerase specialized sigma24 family protein